MNTLSWLIYLAGLIKPLTILLAILLGFVIVVFVLTKCISLFRSNEQDYVQTDKHMEKTKAIAKQSKKALIFSIILGSLLVIIPNERTFYMIAGSEVAGSIVTTDMGKDILEDLQKTIKTKLEQYREEDTKEVKVQSENTVVDTSDMSDADILGLTEKEFDDALKRFELATDKLKKLKSMTETFN